MGYCSLPPVFLPSLTYKYSKAVKFLHFSSAIFALYKIKIEVAIGPVTGSVSCGYRSGSLIYDTLRMSTRRFVDLEI